MKVRVAYTIDVTDKRRRAIRRYFGEEGLATRQEIQSWYEQFGGTMDDDLDAGEDETAATSEDAAS